MRAGGRREKPHGDQEGAAGEVGGDSAGGTYGEVSFGRNVKKEAMKQVAKDRGISKRDVYQALLSEEE